MTPLEHPDILHLNAAQGWLELGNASEATLELAKIAPRYLEHPDVLQLRFQIASQSKDWAEALALAEALCRTDPANPSGPIHRSYCLHELKRTREAWDALLPIASKFPQEWLMCYNLACYACQLGWLQEAKSWLMRAIELGDALEINRLAADDPDLKPLAGQW